MEDRKVILVGAFREMAELCEECGKSIAVVVDDSCQGTFMNYPVIGGDEEFIKQKEQYINIPLVIVPDAPKTRKKLVTLYASHGFHFATIISPYAHVSPSATIGEGCVIQANCNVSSNVQLGSFVKINTNANVMHDTIVEEYVTIAPNAVVLGRCVIEKEVYIGANATILPEKKIKNRSIVGAGAVITKDIEAGRTMISTAARELNK